jgi:hypothetical protein
VVENDLAGEGEAIAVNAQDRDALVRFSSACRVVLNCAGPTFRVKDRVARAAFVAGADYVDVAGDDILYNLLAVAEQDVRASVLAAGMLPGLSGLLPQHLARQGFTSASRLTAFAGGRDRFSTAAAADYWSTLGQGWGDPGAVWRDGGRIPRALTPLRDIELPFFPGRVSAHPYLSAESQRMAEALGLVEARWYTVFDGDHVPAALARLQARPDGDLMAAGEELRRAAELDLFGRDPYQLFVLSLEGEGAGKRLVRTLVLWGSNASELTGTVAAAATLAVSRGEIPPGLHRAAEVLDPGACVDRLSETPAVTTLEVLEGPAHGEGEQVDFEEGVV